MISVQDAKLQIKNCLPALTEETLALSQSAGRTLSQPVYASHDMPSFNSSGMDGFGIHWQVGDDITSTEFEEVEALYAGDVKPVSLAAGQTIRIMTGAPVPECVTAVIQKEWATVQQDGHIRFSRNPHVVGMNIRLGGEDFRRGDLVLDRGAVLNPAAMSVLSGFGDLPLAVWRQPKIAIISTGDEIVSLDKPLQPGQVHNSNAWQLKLSLQGLGCEIMDLGIVSDDKDKLQEAFSKALQADMVITTGGVSVGDKDFVKSVWKDLGARDVFWRIAQKPGKPVYFSVHEDTLIFGLPGNPGAVAICLQEYIQPAIRSMLQHPHPELPETVAELGAAIKKKEGFTFFIRSTVKMENGRLVAWPVGSQSSGCIGNLRSTNALIVAPPDVDHLQAGESVCVHILDGQSVFQHITEPVREPVG